jgi:hypothetical protein
VQRTVYDATETTQLITGYAGLYGTSVGQPAPGHAYRLAAEWWPALNGGANHLFVVVPRKATGADCGRLAYQASGSSWSVGPPPGGTATIGAVSGTSNLPYFNNQTVLSTNDVGPAQSCVNTYQCVPWPMTNCGFFLPGYKGHPVSYYPTAADASGVDPNTSCGGATDTIDGLMIYNTMEYYLR